MILIRLMVLSFNYRMGDGYSLMVDKNNNFYYVFRLSGEARSKYQTLYGVTKYVVTPLDEVASITPTFCVVARLLYQLPKHRCQYTLRLP